MLSNLRRDPFPRFLLREFFSHWFASVLLHGNGAGNLGPLLVARPRVEQRGRDGRTAELLFYERKVAVAATRCDARLCFETCVCGLSVGNPQTRQSKSTQQYGRTIIWPRSDSRIAFVLDLWSWWLGAAGATNRHSDPLKKSKKDDLRPPFRLLDGLRLPALPYNP